MPTVTNTVKYPNGTVAAGRVTIDLVGTNGRPLTDGAYVSGSPDYSIEGTYSADLVAGLWSATLVANSLITPSGTRWRVQESVDGRVTTYYLNVPNGAGPYEATEPGVIDEAPASIASSALSAHLTDTTDAHDVAAVTNAASLVSENHFQTDPTEIPLKFTRRFNNGDARLMEVHSSGGFGSGSQIFYIDDDGGLRSRAFLVISGGWDAGANTIPAPNSDSSMIAAWADTGAGSSVFISRGSGQSSHHFRALRTTGTRGFEIADKGSLDFYDIDTFGEEDQAPTADTSGGGSVKALRLQTNFDGGSTPHLYAIDSAGALYEIRLVTRGTRVDSNFYTTANLTLNSTTFADVDPSGTAAARNLDVVLSAKTGDWVELGLSARTDAGAVTLYLDMASIVSSAPVNYISGGAGDGIQGWSGVNGQTTPISGNVLYQVQAGDIENGQVRFRLRYRTTAATNKVVVATTTQPLQTFGKVL